MQMSMPDTDERPEALERLERVEAKLDAVLDQRHQHGQKRDFELDRLSRKIEETLNVLCGDEA